MQQDPKAKLPRPTYSIIRDDHHLSAMIRLTGGNAPSALDKSSLLHSTLKLLLFYGLPAVYPPGQLDVRRLRENQEPRSWNELVRLQQVGSYTEILFWCRGGSGRNASQLSTFQSPPFDDSLDWTFVNKVWNYLAEALPLKHQRLFSTFRS